MNIRTAGVLGICLSLLSSVAMAAERRFDKTLTVTPGGKLHVDADGCDVTVTGTDADKVVVEIYVKGSRRKVDDMTLSAEKAGDEVTVLAKQDRGSWVDWLSFNFSLDEARINIQVPHRYDIDLRTSGGDLKISQVEGKARGHTSGGDVHLDRLRGDVALATSGGDIEAKQIDGPLRVNTSGGDVTANSVRGDVDMETSGGNVRGEKIDGAIRAKTSGGNVTLELVGPNRGVTASSSGGNVILHLPKDTKATVDASTSGGSVTSDLPVSATRVAEGKMNGTINGGGEEIRLRTSGGNIKLRVSGGTPAVE